MKTVTVITGGEDGYVRIWDASIQLKQQIDCKQAVGIQDLKNMNSYGIQSLDVYACDRHAVQSTATVKVLAGMRSGDILQIAVDFNRNFVTAEDIINNKKLTNE